MTKSKKRIIIAAAAAVVVLAAVLVIVLTLPKTRVSSISIGRNEMPRLSYVQGQELDLSEGVLTVSYSDGTTETLALDAEGVEISGYDPDQTGTQTVTVRFEEQIFNFDVTVIERIRVENAQTVYYEGEALDTSRGRLVIARDDATTFNVPFSDSTVTFEGFDSSEPAVDQQITVRYQSGEQNYAAVYAVTVYTTDNAVLTPPRKTDYRSHEEFQPSGAYITYSNGDPSYDKSIPVTEDMISGLDFSLVTPENSPMEQTAVVTYGGREYPFTVTVTYSQVTALQDLLEEYAFVWNEPEIPEITEETGQRAEECLELYLALSGTERAYVQDILPAIRIAAVYAAGQWREALEACQDCFFVADGSVRYTLVSYAAAATALETVSDESAALNALAEEIRSVFLINFPAQEIGGQRMDEYLSDVTAYLDGKEDLSGVLTFLTGLYETLEGVPSDAPDLTVYGTEFQEALAMLLPEEGEQAPDLAPYRQVIAQVSAWRENHDFFDLLYAYCLAAEDPDSIEKLKEIVLPADLEALYNDLINAVIEYSAITEGTGNGRSSDSTLMVYYYRLAREAAAGIAAQGEGMIFDLYGDLTFNGVLSDGEGEPIPVSFDDLFVFLESSEAGYFELMAGVLDDPDLTALWEAYLELLDTPDAELDARMQAFAGDLLALRPGQLNSFLYSVNVYYAGYELPALDTENQYTVLIRMLTSYFGERFSEEEFSMFRSLLLAAEHFASVSEREDAVTDFLTALGQVTEAYDAAADKADFEACFGEAYRQLLSFAALYDEDGTLKPITVPEEWQQVLEALAAQINNVFYADSLISPAEGSDAAPENAHIRLFASYETARQLAERILTEAPEAVRQAYLCRMVDFGEISMTLDYAMSVAMSMGVRRYADLRLTYDDGTSGPTIWDIVFESPDLRAFLAKAEPVLWTDPEGEAYLSAEEAAGVMEAFLELSADEQSLFNMLQSFQEGKAYYYDGLSAVFAGHFAQSAALQTAAEALLDLEQAALEWLNFQGETDLSEEQQADLEAARQAAQAALTAMEEALAALSESERTEFDALFAGIWTHYQEVLADLGA